MLMNKTINCFTSRLATWTSTQTVDKDAFKLWVTLLIGSNSKSKLGDHTNVAKK